jgi:hypothetical protein
VEEVVVVVVVVTVVVTVEAVLEVEVIQALEDRGIHPPPENAMFVTKKAILWPIVLRFKFFRTSSELLQDKIHQQKCKSFTGSRDHPGAAGLLGRNVSSDRTGASAGPTRPLSMTTALPGTSDYTSTHHHGLPGLLGLNLDGISIYICIYFFNIHLFLPNGFQLF